MPRRTPRTWTHLTAVLALLVLSLGLPRLLVLCSHADGSSSLTFAHPAGSCCHDHTLVPATVDAAHAGTPGGGTQAEPHDHCNHSELGIELMPAPRPATYAPPVPTLVGDFVAVGVPPASPRAHPSPPPATGPPRIDRRTALRATTLLLV